MLANWEQWFLADWHWLMVLIALILLFVFGWVVVVCDGDDWWVL